MRLTILPILALAFSGTSAIAADSSIHSMMVGDKALQLVDTRQLTFKEDGKVYAAAISPDGRCVAYVSNSKEAEKLCVVKTSGGRPTVLATGIGTDADLLPGKPDGTELWRIWPSADWSGDSKCIATSAEKSVWKAGQRTSQDYILVYSITGRLLASLPSAGNILGLKLSPQGKHVAAVVSTADPDKMSTDAADFELVVYDVGKSTLQTLSQKEIVNIRGWADSGRSLIYSVSEKSRTICRKQSIDGSADVVTLDGYDSDSSPDGRLKVVHAENGLAVQNVATGTQVSIVKSGSYRFIGWSPDSKFMVLAEDAVITDGNYARPTKSFRLWLAGTEKHSLNTLLVALDSAFSTTWSFDAGKLAYMSGRRVYVAELEWRAPTADEKLSAGLKLTEEEEKRVLMKNGSKIGVGFEQYTMEKASELPGGPSDLQPYVPAKTFLRPGTDQMIFKFLLPEDPWKTNSEGKRYIPGDTIIGEFDSGYSWKVVVYVGGRAEVVQK